MRIFLSLLPLGNSSVPGSKTWLNNLYEPLLDLGHDVFLVRIDEAAEYLKVKRGTPKFKDKFSEYILQSFKKEYTVQKFDLFISYFWDNYIHAQVIDEIKEMGVPTANFSCNNTHQFYLTKNIAPHYDYNLHSEKNAGEKFKEIGANPVWFQMAANKKYYHPVQCDFKYDVSFIGSSYAKRANYIYQLLENNIDVHCFGPNWLINRPHEKIKKVYKEIKRVQKLIKSIFSCSEINRFVLSSDVQNYDFQCYLRKKYPQNLHHPITDKEMIKLYSESKINLGFLEVYTIDNDGHTITKQHLHLREFEIPMSGGLYFTNYSDELAEFYEPDKEVVIFRNEHELLDKARYYLANKKEAELIRKAGYKRAMQCHTYQKRFQHLFNEMGFK